MTKKTKLDNKRIVYIQWEDSASVDGVVWQFKDDWVCESHNCFTVGFLVSEDKNTVVVAQSENDDQWGRLFAIPKKSIIEIKELK